VRLILWRRYLTFSCQSSNVKEGRIVSEHHQSSLTPPSLVMFSIICHKSEHCSTTCGRPKNNMTIKFI
jgi:hypothetical protein